MSKVNNSVRVSYIVTTRNRADFLDRALENVREFITPEDELIVTDGGSTDHTFDVIRKHQDIINLFISEPDHGEAHGYNKGFLESRGRYIKVITDDDYFFPNAMREAISIMEGNPELDAVMCGGEEYYVDPDTNEQRLTRYQHLPQSRSLTDDVDNVSIFVTCGIGLILTRRAVSRVGLFDTSFHAVDLEYLARLMSFSLEFKYLNLKLWRHVNYPHSGENNTEKCGWDHLRASLRHGLWNRIITHPAGRLAKALGLDSVENGFLLAEMLKEANWLRLKIPMLLSFLIWSLQTFHKTCYWGGSVLRVWRHLMKNSRPHQGADLLIEPQWDGSLR